MSNDVSGIPASAENPQLESAQSESLSVQFESTTEAAPPLRVPVEVVVHGQEDEDGQDDTQQTQHVHEAEAEKVNSLTVDPAEEVAILLGEKESPVSDAVIEQPPKKAKKKNVTKLVAKELDAKKLVAKKLVAKKLVAKKLVDEELEPVELEQPPKKAKPKKVAKPIAEETVAEELEADETEPTKSHEFDELGLSPDVMSAIHSAGYRTPSPIQSETVPYILAGRDLMGQAETGSGKTAAFAWPLLSMIDTDLAKPQVLVLAPTRELAIQVTAAFQKYARGIKNFRAVTIYGGQSYETQLRALSRGVQVVVGTPGRVMDHLRRHTLDLRNLKTLVLDEADEMLRMGFIDDVEWILEQIPGERQILSFSATLPEPIQRIAKKYLKNPANIAIKSDTKTADSIEQSCLFLHAREKLERLVRILETEETEGVLVFVKTRATTVMVAEGLIQRGIIASPLNGDIPQSQRERTVNQLKSGRINVVVATDVAARGLDVQRISHVINYDFPHDTEAYVHRIGRTGRAGRSGNAILFVEPKEKGKLSRLQHATNQRIDQFKQKSIDEINKVRVENFKQQVITTTEDKQVKYFAELISELQSETDIPYSEIAGALAVLAQGDTPLLLKELTNSKSNWKKDGDKRGGPRERGPMSTYRVEVGREHGVGPGNIVGAVTNEANLSNGEIGRINIFDRFSTIDLPADISQDLIEHLKQVQVSGQRLDISKSERSYAKSGGRKSGPSHSRGARSEGGNRYGDKKYGDKKFGDKKYGDKKYGDKKFTSRSSENTNVSDGPKRSYADKKPAETKSFEKKPFETKAVEAKPFEKKPFDSKDFEKKTFEKKPYESKSFEKKPYESKSFEKKSYEKKPFEKKPFERKPAEGKFAARKPSKGKSNATGERTELGEKRDRYAREEGSRYSSGSSKFSKPKPKVVKTKAAERTKAKRKPGAKPSSPMKKYVKIRSAK